MKHISVSHALFSLALLVAGTNLYGQQASKHKQTAKPKQEWRAKVSPKSQQEEVNITNQQSNFVDAASQRNNEFIATICADAKLHDMKPFLNVFVYEIPAMLTDFDKAVQAAKKQGSYYEAWVRLSEEKKNRLKKEAAYSSYNKIVGSKNGDLATQTVADYFTMHGTEIFNTAAEIYAPETKWSTTFAKFRPASLKSFSIKASAVLATALVGIFTYKTGTLKKVNFSKFAMPKFSNFKMPFVRA